MVLGRAANYHGGIKLFNIKTKRTLARNTYKVLGENQSIHGFLYDQPIVIEIHTDNDHLPDILPDSDHTPLEVGWHFPTHTYDNSSKQPLLHEFSHILEDTPLLHILPLTLNTSPNLTPLPEEILEEVNQNEEEYVELDKATCRKDALPFFDYIDRIWGEKGETDNTYSQIWHICSIVAAVDHPRTYYFKYFKHGESKPWNDNDFEYSLCKVLLTSNWADFDIGKAIAHASSRRKLKPDIPQNFTEIVAHKDQGYFLAFFDEVKSWKDTKTLLPNFDLIDWNSIDPALIGDLSSMYWVGEGRSIDDYGPFKSLGEEFR
jgi:hypothetical protein